MSYISDPTIRLADKLQRAARDGKLGFADRAHRSTHDEVPDIPRIVADHVTDYWGATQKDVWDVRKDFPCVRPPYDKCWIETTRPSIIRLADGTVLDAREYPPQWGALFRCAPCPEFPWAKWGVTADLYVVMAEPVERILWLGVFTHLVEEDGRIARLPTDFEAENPHEDLDSAQHYWAFLPTRDLNYRESKWRDYLNWLAGLMDPLLLCTSLMACVNVELEPITPTPAKKQFNTARRLTATSHTIVHVMSRGVRRAVARTTASGRQSPRFHMVRGHFCRRRKAGTNLKQLWWRNAFTKGDASLGAIAHDEYQVDP